MLLEVMGWLEKTFRAFKMLLEHLKCYWSIQNATGAFKFDFEFFAALY